MAVAVIDINALQDVRAMAALPADTTILIPDVALVERCQTPGDEEQGIKGLTRNILDRLDCVFLTKSITELINEEFDHAVPVADVRNLEVTPWFRQCVVDLHTDSATERDWSDFRGIIPEYYRGDYNREFAMKGHSGWVKTLQLEGRLEAIRQGDSEAINSALVTTVRDIVVNFPTGASKQRIHGADALYLASKRSALLCSTLTIIANSLWWIPADQQGLHNRNDKNLARDRNDAAYIATALIANAEFRTRDKRAKVLHNWCKSALDTLLGL